MSSLLDRRLSSKVELFLGSFYKILRITISHIHSHLNYIKCALYHQNDSQLDYNELITRSRPIIFLTKIKYCYTHNNTILRCCVQRCFSGTLMPFLVTEIMGKNDSIQQRRGPFTNCAGSRLRFFRSSSSFACQNV